MSSKSRFGPCHTWRNLFSRNIVIVAAFSALSTTVVAGENTKPVSINCASKSRIDLSSVDKNDFAYSLIVRAANGKKMDMEPMQAFGELDTLLTSSYGLRKPLATVTHQRARNQLALASQMVMSGYVVAAKMLVGVIERESTLPPETIRIVKNMVYTLHEPTDHGDILRSLETKVEIADAGLAQVTEQRQPFARWVVRGYTYNDPVAVDAAIKGYCSVPGAKQDDVILSRISRKARFDPRTITIVNPK